MDIVAAPLLGISEHIPYEYNLDAFCAFRIKFML